MLLKIMLAMVMAEPRLEPRWPCVLRERNHNRTQTIGLAWGLPCWCSQQLDPKSITLTDTWPFWYSTIFSYRRKTYVKSMRHFSRHLLSSVLTKLGGPVQIEAPPRLFTTSTHSHVLWLPITSWSVSYQYLLPTHWPSGTFMIHSLTEKHWVKGALGFRPQI